MWTLPSLAWLHMCSKLVPCHYHGSPFVLLLPQSSVEDGSLPAVVSLILSIDLSSRDHLEVFPHALEHDRTHSPRPIISCGVMTAVAPRFGSEDMFAVGRTARICCRKGTLGLALGG